VELDLLGAVRHLEHLVVPPLVGVHLGSTVAQGEHPVGPLLQNLDAPVAAPDLGVDDLRRDDVLDFLYAR
jgi:hypothetical protein